MKQLGTKILIQADLLEEEKRYETAIPCMSFRMAGNLSVERPGSRDNLNRFPGWGASPKPLGLVPEKNSCSPTISCQGVVPDGRFESL